MKAITLHQPWAYLVFAKGRNMPKDIENRRRRTRHRGPLAIHAGLRRPKREELEAIARFYGVAIPLDPNDPAYVYGAVVGIVDVEDSCERHELLNGGETRLSRWANGPHCWLLARPRALKKPEHCRGFQGMWNWEPAP